MSEIIVDPNNPAHGLKVNADGTINILSSDALMWDTITPTFNSTSDVYVYTLGGVTQQTITLNYTDSTKATLLSVVKS